MYFQRVCMVVVTWSWFPAVLSTCASENDEKICVAPDALRALMRINKEKVKDDTIRPAFFATIKVHPYTAQGLEVVKFDGVRINRGGGYNPVTGYFTAPRKGLYHISCMLLGISGENFHFQLNKNDTAYTYGYVDKLGTQTISALVEMKEGDRVFIKHRVSSSQRVQGNHHSTFSGYFVSE